MNFLTVSSQNSDLIKRISKHINTDVILCPFEILLQKMIIHLHDIFNSVLYNNPLLHTQTYITLKMQIQKELSTYLYRNTSRITHRIPKVFLNRVKDRYVGHSTTWTTSFSHYVSLFWDYVSYSVRMQFRSKKKRKKS